ncbi:helix-turn-helix transcriptional regulator [Streptomyces sp. NPDC055692]|uniref:helix-turn-helix domain-containing protein n=1 Tax=Streptomyces sp. NPDC055692 TaxID=3155683 RepID=UPI003428C652
MLCRPYHLRFCAMRAIRRARRLQDERRSQSPPHQNSPAPYPGSNEAARRGKARMSQDATPDPYTDPLKFGQRVQILRERRGMTQVQLADLVGISPHTMRKIENGQQKAPGLEMVLRIAEALRVHNLAELTGRPEAHVDLFVGPGHPRLAAVKSAIDSFPLTNSVEPPPVAQKLLPFRA